MVRLTGNARNLGDAGFRADTGFGVAGRAFWGQTMRLGALTDKSQEAAVNSLTRFKTYLMVCSLTVLLQPLHTLAQLNSEASQARDGQHDFDFNLRPGTLT
jgi:hypothetical protein